MSAILVLKEMPKTCKECPCQMMLVCVPADEDIDEYVNPNETKPDWCPLIPLPCKLEELEGSLGQRFLSLKAFNRGWNACLDEILGETE